MDRPTYKPIGSVLSSFLDENLSAKAGKVSSFFKSWRTIAGERLSSHSRVAEVENGIVIVEADHPSWIQLLQMRQEEMLLAIEKGWPELSVRGIAFRIRKDAPPRSATAVAPPEAAVQSRMDRAEAREEVQSGDVSPSAPVDASANAPANAPERARPRRPDGPIKDPKLSEALKKLKDTITERRTAKD